MNRLTRRLAAHQERQQDALLAHAHAAASALDRAVAGVWQRLLRVIGTRHGLHADYLRALAVLSTVPHRITSELAGRLTDVYVAAHQTAVQGVRQTLPSEVLIRGYERSHLRAVRSDSESGLRLAPGQQRARAAVASAATRQRLEDAATRESAARPRVVYARQSELKRLLEDDETDRELSDAERRDALLGLLFPAPDYADVYGALAPWLASEDWTQLGDGTEKRLPPDLAQQIASAMSQGKTQREVAAEVRPYLDGSRVRAARAARTFGMHVAHTAQQDAWQGLGDMLIGYTLHSTKGPTTRPWHRDRDGRQYFIDPQPEQDGMEKCPHPPLEPADLSERPAGTPETAWNCL